MPDYKITVKVPNEAKLGTPGGAAQYHKVERLVRAKNEAAAVKHVVTDTVTIDRATGDDYMRLSKAGVEIETAA